MSNLENRPALTPFGSAAEADAVAEVLPARRVPLGGVRGLQVDRVLPQRALPTVGAWCFLDRFGPESARMKVLPHPHIGLQTVTWPLSGDIRHRDSVGSDVLVRPGQLNLMTAGRGVAHSEFSAGETPVLHGLQLWAALPSAHASIDPAFEQHTDLPRYVEAGLVAVVLMGELAGAASRATTHSPLLAADVTLSIGTVTTLPLRPDFEHAVLVVDGAVTVDGNELPPGPLLYLGTGRTELTFAASEPARLMLLGGEPFPDDLVMWWNFVGRDHDEIAAARADWEGRDPARFGHVAGHGDERIPAPELPGVRLTPRRRR